MVFGHIGLIERINNMRDCLYRGDSFDAYNQWPNPDLIISDGPYGVNGYDGDFDSPTDLIPFYDKHIRAWTKYANPGATLWFWNTELGWATVHSLFDKYGWEYKGVNTWNKGRGFIAGNINTKSLSSFPVVTEVAVQYVLNPRFSDNGRKVSEQHWLRSEWQRTGLPLNKSNEAVGVKSAATRKYLTKDNLWYSPPANQFAKMVKYANEFGNPKGRPYYSLNGKTPLTDRDWERIHPTFKLPVGYTNVWNVPKVSGKERIKVKSGSFKALHSNQKPLSLMKLLISTSSNEGDVVWEPFGGLASASVESLKLNREPYVAEINPKFYDAIECRLKQASQTIQLPLTILS